jgi:hypothetical protein
MFAGLLATILVLVQPDAIGFEALIAAALIATVVAISMALQPAGGLRLEAATRILNGFADLRVLLRADDPDAEGHRRARAPGTAL